MATAEVPPAGVPPAEEQPPTPPTAAPMEELYRELWAPLLRLAFFLVGQQAMAEDLVQDAFVRLDRAKRPPDNPQAYLRKIVVNLAHDRRRREAVERKHLVLPPSVAIDPEIEDVWNHLWDLPTRERHALALRYYGDLSVAEVAETLGCPLGTAKSLIHRGLLALRSSMEGDR